MLGKQEPVAKQTKPVVKKVAPVRLDLPDVNLDGDLLFTLLTGEMAGYRGELGLATAQYLRAAKQTRDPRVIERAVRVASYAKLYKQGLEAARLWIEIKPNSEAAQANLASLLLRNNLKAEALTAYDELIESSSDKQARFIQLGKKLLHEKNRQQVLEMMQQLVVRYSKVASAHFLLSSLAEQAGKFSLAESAIRQAIILKANWTAAQNQLARILHLQGNTLDAIAYLEKVLKDTPDNTVIRLSYARLLVDAKELDKARDEFERLAVDAPENANILFALGILALQSENLEHAVKYFEQVKDKGRRGLEASYYLGQIAEQKENYSKAIVHYGRVSRGEYAFDSQLRIVKILVKQGKVDLALATLDNVSIRGDAQLVSVILSKGDILRSEKRFSDAMKGYNKGLEKLPGNSDLLYARALMAERVGRIDILMVDLKTILKTEPNNAHALNALGYTLADNHTGKLKEAFKYIKRALKLLPDDPAIIDSMGWIQYRLGNYKEALKHLTRAYDLNDDAEIAAHLGEVLWALGEKVRASKVWRQGLEQAPGDERLLEVIKRLEL
ncbi:MAG: tetratricopeptide repeat protein [Sulfuriflexus sp.]|nr:tetratricopeptide repeat protein [Sulfuriflexus sp.]